MTISQRITALRHRPTLKSDPTFSMSNAQKDKKLIPSTKQRLRRKYLLNRVFRTTLTVCLIPRVSQDYQKENGATIKNAFVVVTKKLCCRI